MDLDYIRRRDLWLDLKILVKTIPAVVSGKGAY
jgi:lipopolysaccharide/colanic/teichoic acid biosynthesis glycosyltransferase